MRTQEEITERIDGRQERDVLGFEWHEYVGALGWEHGKQYLKEDTKLIEDDWELEFPTQESIMARMKDYMEFAWDKANNCRGISASRSIAHYVAWIWLYGDDEFAKEIEGAFDHNYEYYGKDILAKICDKYGWDYKQWDDSRRSNSEN